MTTQGNKCPICLKLFNDPRWMPCKHIYCFKCIPYLHRRDLDTKDEIILECRICAMRHSFRDWSTVKYYVTLHCVPYITARQFDNTLITSTKSLCSICFNINSKDLEYCIHCDKNICRECFINHRMELKKNILSTIDQCHRFIRKNQQDTKEITDKIDNMELHIDFCTSELIDQIDAYSDSILAQLDEYTLSEDANSSSGYDSLTEQQPSEYVGSMQKNVILLEPSIIPFHLIGELISSDSNIPVSFVSQILWTMICSFYPSHIVFDSNSSKLFICCQQGSISVYNYTTTSLVLVDRFILQYNEEYKSMIVIKSMAVSTSSLIVVFNSPFESIIHFYSFNGILLRSLSLHNEYISQIRFNNNYLWCLELISSSLSYFIFQSNNSFERKQFISFKQRSFNPFRFAVNDLFVAALDRALTGLILVFDKQTSSIVKQIQSPLIDFQPCDIELTNQTLIYRFHHRILLIQLDNEQYIEHIDANKNINITLGKSNNEILLSSLTDDNNTFIVQCYII